MPRRNSHQKKNIRARLFDWGWHLFEVLFLKQEWRLKRSCPRKLLRSASCFSSNYLGFRRGFCWIFGRFSNTPLGIVVPSKKKWVCPISTGQAARRCPRSLAMWGPWSGRRMQQSFTGVIVSDKSADIYVSRPRSRQSFSLRPSIVCLFCYLCRGGKEEHCLILATTRPN